MRLLPLSLRLDDDAFGGDAEVGLVKNFPQSIFKDRRVVRRVNVNSSLDLKSEFHSAHLRCPPGPAAGPILSCGNLRKAFAHARLGLVRRFP